MPSGLESSGSILDEGDAVAQFHTETGRSLDAGIRDKADKNNLLNAMLLKLHVEISIRETILHPVLR